MALLAQYLPEDIIHEFFLALSSIDIPSRKLDYRKANLGWINASHTCRRWRSIALASPALWAGAIPAFPRGRSTRLKRSKRTHLTLDLTGVSRKEFLRLAELFPRARHLRQDLWRNMPSFGWPDALSGLALPLLEAIDIHGSVGENIRGIHPPYKVTGVAPFSAPSLRTCSFHRIFVPFIAPNLRSLTMHDSYMGFMRLLCTLQNCPGLEHLMTIGGLGVSPMGTSPAVAESIMEMDLAFASALTSTVRLPRLQSLSVYGYPPDVASLLQHMQFPLSARFDIEYSGYSDLDEFGELVLALRAQISGFKTLTITAIDEYPHGLEFYLNDDVPFPDHGGIPKEGSSLKTSYAEWTGKLPQLLDAFPPASIRTLAIAGNEDQMVIRGREPDKLLRSLRRFTSVQTLYLQESSYELLQILVSSVSVQGDIFPELRTVIIHHAQDYYPPSEVWWSRLVKYLEARKEARIPIHTLIVRGNFCHLGREHGEVPRREMSLEGVRALVEEVVDNRHDKCCCDNE
ncbi:hypothetical protein PENSPDRAFT_175659 [Peniophora sp. CONT]|nr:hypothetical protein PENSPDRAFT_175659 [Peniophora sp. CONT]